MKLSKLKIDGILIFYVLSLGLIGLSWKYGLIQLKETSVLTLPQQFEIEDKLHLDYTEDGSLNRLYVLNPSLKIHYSLDGGDSFYESGTELSLEEVENPSINQIPASVRWMPDYSEIEKVKSVVVFLEHTLKSCRSSLKTYTSVSSADTELPIVHLNMSNTELFDPCDGLLVPGSSSWYPTQVRQEWWAKEANYTQRGSAWEKQASLQVFEGQALTFESQAGIRISGNGTRSYPQKSFRVKARQQYESDKFESRLFGEEGLKKYESLVLRMSGNDNTATMFADLLMQNLAQGSNLITQKGMPVRLYINGNCWGLYNLRERIDDYFVAKYADSKKAKVTILEGAQGALKDGDEEVHQSFVDFMDEVRGFATVGDAEYLLIEETIDLDSYMDYIFFETYYANNDWPSNNSICYKADEQKWKWLLNDLDFSLAYPGPQNLELNMFERMKQYNSVHAILFNKLSSNPAFVAAFKTRAEENMDTFLSEKRINEEYSELKAQYQPEIEHQIKRWRMIDSIEAWETSCQNNLTYLIERRVNYRNHLNNL